MPLRRALRSPPLLLILASCAGPAPVAQSACPPVQAYSAEFFDAARAELQEIADTAPHIAQMIVDYNRERKVLRACRVAQ